MTDRVVRGEERRGEERCREGGMGIGCEYEDVRTAYGTALLFEKERTEFAWFCLVLLLCLVFELCCAVLCCAVLGWARRRVLERSP